MAKEKCKKCGHFKNVHLSVKEYGPGAGCCVQYRGPDGNIKCCPCMEDSQSD